MGIVKEFCDLTKNTRKNNKILAWLNIWYTMCLVGKASIFKECECSTYFYIPEIKFHFVLYCLKQTLISLWESTAGAIFYCYPQPFTSSLNFVYIFPFLYQLSATCYTLSLPFWFRYHKIGVWKHATVCQHLIPEFK